MLVVIPFCAKDKALAVRLAQWILELGGVSKHDCLLAVHKDTDSAGVIEPLTKAFGRIAEFDITDDMIVEREHYVYAANLMWKRTCNHIAGMNEPQPWLWLEPDATPTDKAWLDSLAKEHADCGKPFLHDLVRTPEGNRNSGCGIYPARVHDYTDRLWQLSNVSWDVLLHHDFQPHTHYTQLIQDVGFMFNNPEIIPTFPDAESLGFIRPGAVLFHRCRDGTLIDRLRETAGASPAPAIKPKTTPEIAAMVIERSNLIDRIAELEAKLSGVPASVPARSGNGAKLIPSLKPARRTPNKKRTKAEQAAIDARMAAMRAKRKRVAA